MKVRVLGSAAGGGFPQWNCGCDNCLRARSGDRALTPRTQESVALSADGDAWFLLNASPEVRGQIESFAGLHPRGRRHSPIQGVVLTNGDLDHCLGLFSLRESHPLQLYTTAAIHGGLADDNVLFRTLQRFDGHLRFHELVIGQRVPLTLVSGEPSGLQIEAVPSPGKVPIHLEGRAQSGPHDNIGLLIRGGGSTLAYFPGVAAPTAEVKQAIAQADLVFFDGTFWSSDELPASGLGEKRAEDMAHWPLGGPEGSLRELAAITHARRVLIHINNTNPILRDDSAEARRVREAGVEIATDGMELAL